MGSEGYFINQFLVTHTNQRTRRVGRRLREPHAAAGGDRARVREAVGRDFIIIYRLSMLDLIPDGSSWPEAVTLAKAVTAAGATIINTGIGWHEARMPTIATSVPRGAFAWVTKKMRDELRAAGRHDPARHQQPHQHARGRRAGAGRRLRRHGQPGAPAARRSRLRRQGEGRAARRTSTPASPATRPASTTRSRTKLASCLVNPRAGHETELLIQRRGATQALRRGRRRAGRTGGGHDAGRARPRGAPVRGRGADRRPVQHGEAHPGQGGVQRDAALLRAPDRSDRRPAAPEHARRRRRPRRAASSTP